MVVVCSLQSPTCYREHSLYADSDQTTSGVGGKLRASTKRHRQTKRPTAGNCTRRSNRHCYHAGSPGSEARLFILKLPGGCGRRTTFSFHTFRHQWRMTSPCTLQVVVNRACIYIEASHTRLSAGRSGTRPPPATDPCNSHADRISESPTTGLAGLPAAGTEAAKNAISVSSGSCDSTPTHSDDSGEESAELQQPSTLAASTPFALQRRRNWIQPATLPGKNGGAPGGPRRESPALSPSLPLVPGTVVSVISGALDKLTSSAGSPLDESKEIADEPQCVGRANGHEVCLAVVASVFNRFGGLEYVVARLDAGSRPRLSPGAEILPQRLHCADVNQVLPLILPLPAQLDCGSIRRKMCYEACHPNGGTAVATCQEERDDPTLWPQEQQVGNVGRAIASWHSRFQWFLG